jgi:hypothetical protein
MSRWKLFAFSALAVVFVSSVSVSPAQVAISIGAAPICPYGYFDYAPYPCAPYGYYGPDWFTGGGFSSELVPGSMALTASTGTSITATILIMGTLDRCRSAVRSRSTTSRGTRRGMGKAT